MKILLIYHMRLGDILQVLAMARSLTEQGHEVYIECNQEYHSIFKICPYAQAVYPGQKPPPGFKFGWIIDLQIWPSRYHDYRHSKKKWWDFVTSIHPLLTGLPWRSPFVEPLPPFPVDDAKKYVVIANSGYSQMPKINPQKVTDLAGKLYPNLHQLHLGTNTSHGPASYYQATDLCHLAGLIKHAGAVVTINTSVDYFADLLRDHYDHVVNGVEQDDFFSKKQTRHTIAA